MRVAHLSDSHLGYTQYNLVERRKDFFNAFKKAIDKILESNVDVVVHSGDLFEFSQPDVASISFAIKQFRRLKEKGIEVVAIVGNHDRALRRGKMPPQRILEDLGLVRLVYPFGDLTLGDLYIAGFQYIPSVYVPAAREAYFEKFSENASKYNYSILMFHQGVDIFLPHDEAYELKVSDIPQGFKYYAAGHIHRFLKSDLYGGVFSYCGATEFRNISEAQAGRRGFNIFDFSENKIERVELENLRKFLFLSFSEGEEEKVEEICEQASCETLLPVIVLRYFFEKHPLALPDTVWERLKKVSLTVKVIQKKSLTVDEPQKLRVSISRDELVKRFYSGQKEEIVNLAVELFKSEIEHTENILKEYLNARTGIEIE